MSNLSRMVTGILIGLCLSTALAAQEGRSKVVCIGDCITRGVWWSEEVGRGTCWVDRFAGATKGVQVVNAGRDGLEAKHFWYVKELMKENPDASTFILYLGLNDLRGLDSVQPEAASRIAGRIGYMIELIRKGNPQADILVIAPQRINPDALSPKWREEKFGEHTAIMNELLAASLQNIARESKVRFLNLAKQFDCALLPDGVHPGIEGHARLAELIGAALNHPPVINDQPVFAEARIVAPPAEGKPYQDAAGTDEVTAGIMNDLRALRAPEPAPVTAQSSDAKSIVTGFVSSEDRKGIFSEDAYRLGSAVAQAAVDLTEQALEWREIAAMEAIFDGLAAPCEDEIVAIAYAIPEPEIVESFILAIDLPDGGEYSVLGGSVDWNSIEGPQTQAYNDVDLGERANIIAPEAVAFIPREQPVTVERMVGAVIEDFSAGYGLPELKEGPLNKMLLPAGSLVPGIPALGMIASDGVAAVADAPGRTGNGPARKKQPVLMVPGYAVYVHTLPERKPENN